jgi:hypothetical protein
MVGWLGNCCRCMWEWRKCCSSMVAAMKRLLALEDCDYLQLCEQAGSGLLFVYMVKVSLWGLVDFWSVWNVKPGRSLRCWYLRRRVFLPIYVMLVWSWLVLARSPFVWACARGGFGVCNRASKVVSILFAADYGSNGHVLDWFDSILV